MDTLSSAVAKAKAAVEVFGGGGKQCERIEVSTAFTLMHNLCLYVYTLKFVYFKHLLIKYDEMCLFGAI